jgi:hypothetical protein
MVVTKVGMEETVISENMGITTEVEKIAKTIVTVSMVTMMEIINCTIFTNFAA